jgi:hypothetical protein
MKKAFITILAAICIATVILLLPRISGGKAIEQRVEVSVRTNAFLIGLLGEPISSIKQSDGPWRVNLKPDGSRHGFFSFFIVGTRSQGDFKIEWKELQGGAMEVDRIMLRAPYQQDNLLWERSPQNAR